MLKLLIRNDFPHSLRVLLVYTFIMIIGFTMLMPLVAVHFVTNIGMAATVVGAALGVRQFAQQGLTLFGGMLSDKFGYKTILCLGVLLRSVGFFALSWTEDSISWLFFALTITALGGALFEAPYQALIAQQTSAKNRDDYYLVSNFVGGIATALGPLLGIFLLNFDFSLVCYAASFCFLVNFFIAYVYLPTIKFTQDSTNNSRSNIKRLINNRIFLLLILIMAGYWFTAIQINITFPLWAELLTGNKESVGIMYTMIAILTIALQLPLVNYFNKHFKSHQTLLLGIIIMSLSIMMIGLFKDFYLFLLSVAIFTLGALLTKPTQQTLIANLADRKALGIFMGFSSVGLAIGGGIGSVSGGWLFEQSQKHDLFALPWVVFGVFGIFCAFSLHLFLQKNISNQHT